MGLRVDDTFTMFDSKGNANEFLSFVNSRHDSIKFTIEFEEENKIPIFDILLKRCRQHSLHICLPEEDIHRPLHQVGFIHTSQVQNQPHPHTHLSMLPNFLLAILIASRY